MKITDADAASQPFAHLFGLAPRADNKGYPKKSKKASDQDDDDKRDGETQDEYDERKRRERDADDDDSDEEMRGTGLIAAARTRERARLAAIFQHPACGTAQGVEMAYSLAFKTRMSRTEARAILDSYGDTKVVDASAMFSSRASRNPQLGTFNPGAMSAAPADRMVTAMKKSREN
jgi:hypothetical protein